MVWHLWCLVMMWLWRQVRAQGDDAAMIVGWRASSAWSGKIWDKELFVNMMMLLHAIATVVGVIVLFMAGFSVLSFAAVRVAQQLRYYLSHFGV